MNVFISCSPEDKHPSKEILMRLHPFGSRDGFAIWHRGMLVAGSDHGAEAAARLEQSELILLLLSPSFLNSADCNTEMDQALQMHLDGRADVILILLTWVDYQGLPCDSLRALPDTGLPVDDRGWNNQSEAFNNVSVGIRKSIQVWKQQRSSRSRLNSGAVYTRPKQNVISDDLIHMCDRELQESAALIELERAPLERRPYVFIIHGNVDDGLLEYRGRLTGRTLPRALFGSPDNGKVDPIRISVPLVHRPTEEFNRQMWGALAEVTLNNRLAPEKDVLQHLLSRPDPVLLWSEMPSTRWEKLGRRVLDGYITFWNQFPDTLSRHLFACMIITHSPDVAETAETAKAFIETYADAGDAPYRTLDGRDLNQVCLIALPMLEPIRQPEVATWIQDQTVFAGFCPEHPTLCRAGEALSEIRTTIFARSPAIPLYQIAPQLKQLLEKYSCARRSP